MAKIQIYDEAKRGFRLLAIPKKLPPKPGAQADLLYAMRQDRYALQHACEEIEKLEKEIEQHFIETLPVSEASGLAGKLARVQINTKVVPIVEDWDATYKHILKTKDFSLLQRRISESAVKERWEANKQVPGVTKLNAKKVSCTKL